MCHEAEKRSKLEEKLIFYLKNDKRNLVNFSLSSGKSENLHFDGILCRKYLMFELKGYRGAVLWKITYGFKNDISNLVNTEVVESNVR